MTDAVDPSLGRANASDADDERPTLMISRGGPSSALERVVESEVGPRGTHVIAGDHAARLRAVAKASAAGAPRPANGGVVVVEPVPEDEETAADSARRCDRCGSFYSTDARFCPFDGDGLVDAPEWDPRLDPLVGQVVAGRYHVETVLASGGMGTVYRVRHATLGSVFAMKVLRRDLAADANIAARLITEAKATAAIGHPNIAAVTDIGELEVSALADQPAVQLPYFVMEYVHGDTLGMRLRRDGRMSLADTVDVAVKVAGALAAAHRAGIVHRDLKPDNIHVRRDDNGQQLVKVIDFGVAKVMGASKLTRQGMVFGTPFYMSPEQAQGGQVSGRSDIYALGVILYQCLSGQVPFHDDSYMGVVKLHLMSPVPPLPEATGLRGTAIEQVIMRCMHKDAAERYPDMVGVTTALQQASMAGARPVMRHGAASRRAADEAATSAKRWAYVVFFVLLLFVVGTLIWLYLQANGS